MTKEKIHLRERFKNTDHIPPSLKNPLKNTAKGIAIGASMLLPGISGGTMAIMLGIYDRLIASVSGIRTNFKQSIIFLLQVGIGGMIGILLFSKIVLAAVNRFYVPMLFLFMGAIIGSVPLLMRKTGTSVITLRGILACIGGAVGVLLICLLPENLFTIASDISIFGVLQLFVIGIFLAVALVLPGISVSFVLLVFGLYERFLSVLGEGEFSVLIPTALGCVVGVFLTSALLERLMERHSELTFMAIAGFVLGAAVEIFPGLPSGYTLPICATTFVCGFILTYKLSR